MPSTYGTEVRAAIVFAVLLLAAWLIRRAGAGLRAEIEKKHAAGPAVTPEQVAAITSQGLATPEKLFAMSPKEQQLLASTAMAIQAAQNQRRTREQ